MSYTESQERMSFPCIFLTSISHTEIILLDVSVIMQLQKMGVSCCYFANAWGWAHCVHLLMALGGKPTHPLTLGLKYVHTLTRICTETHMRKIITSAGILLSHAECQGDSRTRTNHLINSQKIKSVLASECQTFRLPTAESVSKSQLRVVFSQLSLNTDSIQIHSVEKIPECLMCLFLFSSLLRGLFASHYTETHYQEDGSAVTSPHNFTVR